MKRKVIQIAGSTQLVSLPRKWAKEHNVRKGDEVDVQENGSTVNITVGNLNIVEKAEIDITTLKSMIPRYIHAMYKRGVDELKLSFSDPSILQIVQDSIGRVAVGYEILEHGKNHCIIKYVAGNLEEFDLILRRTFLMLINMADESLEAIKSKNFSHLKNVAFLEDANNRFTTICRRYLNKSGTPKSYSKLGPLYFIVESLERIADYYKYACNYLHEEANQTTVINKSILDIYAKMNMMLHYFYELFYKFDMQKVALIKEMWDDITTEYYSLIKKKLSAIEIVLLHHSVSTSTMIFGLVDPYLVMTIP